MKRSERTGTVGLLVVLATSFAFVACNRQPEPKPAAIRPTAAPEPKRAEVGGVIERPLSSLDVMVLLYGEGGGTKAVPKWRPKKLWQDEDAPPFDDTTEFVCEDVQLLPFRQGDAARAIVLTSARPADHDCHPCGPLLGAVGLTEIANGWRIDSADPEIGPYGAHGLAPGGTIVQFGPEKFGVMLEPGYTAMGTTTSGLSLLAEQRNGGFAEILDLEETESDNSGDCGGEEGAHACWSFSSVWEFVQNPGREIWDFKITTKGSRPGTEDGKTEEFSEGALYRFDGATYVLAK